MFFNIMVKQCQILFFVVAERLGEGLDFNF